VYIDAADDWNANLPCVQGRWTREEAIDNIERVLERNADADLESPPELPMRERGRVNWIGCSARDGLFADDRADYRV